MPFKYKHVLMVGATSGIGLALADVLVQHGVRVIAVGRRQERLDEFVKKHGSDKTSAIKFDITDSAGVKSFSEKVLKEHPDLDCVFLNAGVQSRISLSQDFDAKAFNSEINTNFTSIVELAMTFLPALQAKSYPTSIVITGSGLGFAAATPMPAYSASKAALNSFCMSLRAQTKGGSVQIVELWPPVVQSELHDYMGKERGRALGMPMDVFIKQAWAEFEQNKDFIVIGTMGNYDPEDYRKILAGRDAIFDNIGAALKHVTST